MFGDWIERKSAEWVCCMSRFSRVGWSKMLHFSEWNHSKWTLINCWKTPLFYFYRSNFHTHYTTVNELNISDPTSRQTFSLHQPVWLRPAPQHLPQQLRCLTSHWVFPSFRAPQLLIKHYSNNNSNNFSINWKWTVRLCNLTWIPIRQPWWVPLLRIPRCQAVLPDYLVCWLEFSL